MEHPASASLSSSSSLVRCGMPLEQVPSTYVPFWVFHDSFELSVAGRFDIPRVAYTSRLLALDTAHAKFCILCIVFKVVLAPPTFLPALEDG